MKKQALGARSWALAGAGAANMTSIGHTAGVTAATNLIQNFFVANRRKFLPTRKATSYAVQKGIEHGMSGRILRTGPTVALGVSAGSGSISGYHALHAVGERLSRMPPSDRVLAFRRLKVDLAKTKYLKDAPIVGDLYHAIKDMPEHELLRPHRVGSVLTRASSGTARNTDSLVRASRMTGVAAVPVAPGLLIPMLSPRILREGARSLSHAGPMTSHFVRGVAGKPTGVGARAGQYVLGTFEAEAQDLGRAFRKEMEHNPTAATKVFHDMLDVAAAAPRTFGGRLGVSVAKRVDTEHLKTLSELAAKSPTVMAKIEHQPNAKELGRMVVALQARKKVGLPPDTTMPTFGQIVGALFGGGKRA